MSRLAAREVNFAFGEGPWLVDRWTHEFHAGSVTAITGPSGCGKSTRLYLLGLMLQLADGAIEIDGKRVDDLNDAQRSRLRAERFGFVFQDAALDPTRTVMDNIVETSLYRGQKPTDFHQRALQLLQRFDVAVPSGRRPGEISGGQAQRIALCRALLGNPDIVLADEPTGNLDEGSARIVLNALRSHADTGGCVVIVTHDPDIARWADAELALGALV